MKRTSKSLSIFYIILLVLFVVSFAITFVILFRPIYFWQIDSLKLNEQYIPSLGRALSNAELRSIYNNVMNYLLGISDMNFKPILSSEWGEAHFVDVKYLMLTIVFILIISSGFIAMILIFQNQNKVIKMHEFHRRTPYFYAGIVLVVLIIIVAIIAFNDPEQAFEEFHHLFFPDKENWVLDYRDDEIILLLPFEFFISCFALGGGIVAVLLVGLFVLDFKILKKYAKEPIRLVAIDIDGTIVNSNCELLQETIDDLKEAIAKGVYVVISSGRPFSGLQFIHEALGISNSENYSVILNGAKVVNNDQSTIVSYVTIPFNSLAYYVKLGQDNNVHTQIFKDSEIYTEYINEYIKMEEDRNHIKINISDYSELKDTEVEKFMFADDPTLLSAIRDSLPPKTYFKFNVSFSAPHFLEILSKKATKGFGLAKLVEHLGLSWYNVMAIGDEENDISMLKYAKIKVAMGNATENVKKISNYITDTNDLNGVGKAVKEKIK
jgi:integral membrane protein (TIGR01906 family)